MQTKKHHGIVLASLLAISACSNNNSSSGKPVVEEVPPAGVYRAELIRTDYGIPHITADDWGSLGYGYGYAFAQDNYCVLMREILYANGQSAEFLGSEGNLSSDFVYKWYNGDEQALRDEWLGVQAENFQDMVAGYAAGFNRYFSETGRENLATGSEGCRNAAWTREIDTLDLIKFYRKSLVQGGIDNGIIRDGIVDVQGPQENKATAAKINGTSKSKSKSKGNLFKGFIDPSARGSNALALGGDYTHSGRGMVLGNPHQPWNGVGRWHELHLTIPGEYDVMGATLLGIPTVTIGFNKDLAWTHTNSFASHMSLYELPLNPNNLMQYRYDDEWRDIEAVEVRANQLQPDGSLTEYTRTIYLSHYGPIVDLGRQSELLAGWPMLISDSILAVRDANINNTRGLQQWVAMGQASTVEQFTEALRAMGLPWVHTLAADRNGDAYYAEASAIPHVTKAKLDDCISTPITETITSLTNGLIFALDGSRASCEWGESPDSPPGSNIFGYSELPNLTNRTYTFNANNSYWLSNSDTPLEGFPFQVGTLGGEQEQQFLRSNLGHQKVVERLGASDGVSDTPGFDMYTLKAMMLSNRVLAAEDNLDDILLICAQADDNSEVMEQACEVLASWDRRVNLGSIGAHVFTELWRELANTSNSQGDYFIDQPGFWRESFDPAQPTTTPAGIDIDNPDNHSRVLDALQVAITKLGDAGVSLGAPFGQVQQTERGGEIIPIHGGWDQMGTYNVIKTQLEAGGYRRINGGTTYVQAVTWDDSDCPIAEGMLAHSQSTDAGSPHYLDQTKLYSDKVWLPLPFCRSDIENSEISRTALEGD